MLERVGSGGINYFLFKFYNLGRIVGGVFGRGDGGTLNVVGLFGVGKRILGQV